MNAVLGLVAILYYLLQSGASVSSFFPSSEMKELRQIEQSLSLPKSAQRYETDKGCYTDWKNAGHFDRYILRYYSDMETVTKAKDQVEMSGWKLRKAPEYAWETYYYYENPREPKVEISVGIDRESTDRFPHTLFIRIKDENQCR